MSECLCACALNAGSSIKLLEVKEHTLPSNLNISAFKLMKSTFLITIIIILNGLEFKIIL